MIWVFVVGAGVLAFGILMGYAIAMAALDKITEIGEEELGN